MSMRKTFSLVLGMLWMASSAWAIPSWMGVYGAATRYTTNSNPGTYTILMNQDYYGLRAEVGVRVNGGTWSVYPMVYAGKTDGNSTWTFTPAQPYPASATVKFYFHGYDSAGGHVYDSKSGQNYSLRYRPAVPTA